MTRLFADENFPLRVVAELRRLGHDVLTTQEAGLAEIGTSDPDILSAAISADRAVLTMNRRHFIRLHSGWPAHAGIVGCTFDPDAVRLAQRIDRAISSIYVMTGQLLL